MNHFQIFQNNALLEQTNQDDTEQLYLYHGPKDERNRDFCSALVGKIVKRSILLQLLNKHGAPAIDFVDGEEKHWLGGHGCRHHLVYVTPDMIRQHNLKMATPADYRNAGYTKQVGFPKVEPTTDQIPQADVDVYQSGLFSRYRSSLPKQQTQDDTRYRYRSKLNPEDKENLRYRYRSRPKR